MLKGVPNYLIDISIGIKNNNDNNDNKHTPYFRKKLREKGH